MTTPVRRIRKSLFTPDLTVGDRGYLWHAVPAGTRGAEAWGLSAYKQETNLGHQPITEGWLGMTNDINYYAEGYVEVIPGSSTHYWFQQIEEPEPS